MNYSSVSRKSVDEAEKPFWISYADLMTALMVLFMVIMVTSLSLITQQVQDASSSGPDVEPIDPAPTSMAAVAEDVRNKEITTICSRLSQDLAKTSAAVQVDCRLNRINFGEVGRFGTDEYRLSPEGESTLAQVVPQILEASNSPLGKKWLKQVVIEGFTDTDGSYLYNLNLSLRRSEWVMCSLLRRDGKTQISLSPEQRRQVRKLFLAGGVSFNDAQSSKDASRRVELRLQFYGLDRKAEQNQGYEMKFEDVPNERCYI